MCLCYDLALEWLLRSTALEGYCEVVRAAHVCDRVLGVGRWSCFACLIVCGCRSIQCWASLPPRVCVTWLERIV